MALARSGFRRGQGLEVRSTLTSNGRSRPLRRGFLITTPGPGIVPRYLSPRSLGGAAEVHWQFGRRRCSLTNCLVVRKKGDAVKRWFKPVNGLGYAGNSILYDGLQGSPLFENSECFFLKLKSAIQSREEDSKRLPAPASASTAYTVALPEASETIRRFNRDTRWLAMGVLSVPVCAVFLLAVVQERKPKGDDLRVVNANSFNGFKITGLNGKSSGDKRTSGQASSVDQAHRNLSRGKSSPQMEAAVSTPTPVLGFAPDPSGLELRM
jgi:hypothetical protein